jgi:four helix bundle protein
MGAPINSFKDLIAWKKAFGLGCHVQRLSHQFPKHELFGLTSQVRRAGTSVAMNIAEGCGRGSLLDYVRFLRNARGSMYELDTGLMFATEFGYISQAEYEPTTFQLDEAERVLAGLIRSLDRG